MTIYFFVSILEVYFPKKKFTSVQGNEVFGLSFPNGSVGNPFWLDDSRMTRLWIPARDMQE